MFNNSRFRFFDISLFNNVFISDKIIDMYNKGYMILGLFKLRSCYDDRIIYSSYIDYFNVYNVVINVNSMKYNYMDCFGNLLLSNDYFGCGSFCDGVGIIVDNNGKNNYVNVYGSFLLDKFVDFCNGFVNGIGIFYDKGLYNYVNYYGRVLLDKNVDNCYGFVNGIGIFCDKGLYNYVNLDGSVLLDKNVDDCSFFYKFIDFNYYGIINNNTIVDINGSVVYYSDKYFIKFLNNRFYILDSCDDDEKFDNCLNVLDKSFKEIFKGIEYLNDVDLNSICFSSYFKGYENIILSDDDNFYLHSDLSFIDIKDVYKDMYWYKDYIVGFLLRYTNYDIESYLNG